MLIGGALAAALGFQIGSQARAAVSPLRVAPAHRASGGGVQVTMPPVGLSIEYPLMAEQMGRGTCPPPALVAELQRLGSPPLALAGSSQDLTAPSGVLGAPPPSWETGSLFGLPANFWTQLHCLLAAAKDPLTVGINAERGALAWATQMVAGAQAAATNGLTFSLGNEPDLYVLPNYFSLARKLSLQEDVAAVNLYLRVATGLRPAIGNSPLLGPELATANHWHRQLPGVIAQLHDSTVGVHLYAFSACKEPAAATLKGLLSQSAGDKPRRLAWVVADARAAGVPAIISESNSVSCGGVPGVSNSPASAVWAVRFVLSALKTGFHEVRFHLSNSSYDPFLVHGDAIVHRPLDSALAALNRWLPVGSSIASAGGASGILTTFVSGPPKAAQTILDNERAHPRTIALPASHPVLAQAFTATQGGLQTLTLAPHGGRIKLKVPANSVIALMG